MTWQSSCTGISSVTILRGRAGFQITPRHGWTYRPGLLLGNTRLWKYHDHQARRLRRYHRDSPPLRAPNAFRDDASHRG
jgi:hypothetical protein